SAMTLLQSNETFNLLVTDIGLPNGMNGRQLADAARLQRPQLKVLFITGYAQNAMASHDMLASGMQIMTKPFSMASFAAKVRLLVEEDLDAKMSGDTGNTAKETANDTAKPLTILVVDDNEEAATCLAMLLEASGHMVQVALDGRLGLEAAKVLMPDVILLDIGMPVMDGFETAQAIRKIPPLAHTILVALTGWGGEDERAKSKNAGFDYHLTKPTDLSTIKALLSQLDNPNTGEHGKL
ncbi:response regulator, partial [Paraglaciecola sp.]|uniref:response regulator n=1 Tax=Paraglaciecola sp. TaxID=1920173 RepID=UPI0030F41FA5